MKFVSSIGLFFLLMGCDHPETKMYDRDHKAVTRPEEKTQAERNVPNNSSYIGKGTDYSKNSERIESEYSTSTILRMETENGVRYVWVEINGIRLRFIFDTGASTICISSAEATVMYRQGTLKKEDILNEEYFQDATGRISQGTKINLRSVKIGTKVLTDVEATVIDNIDAPLLLGQTVLENFGSIEIDYENGQIIFK